MTSRLHHTAICPADFDASLRFYRDGLGMEAVMGPTRFSGDWPALFATTGASTLRSVFLGDSATPDAGMLELVEFAGETPDRRSTAGPPSAGFFLVSLYVDVAGTVERLAALGHHGVRRIEVPGPGGRSVVMATVRDPDGVLVELIDRLR